MINLMIIFFRKPYLLLVLSSMTIITLVEGYSRNDLQELYPGFGTEFIIFPDENNNPILGYLKLQNDSRIVKEQKFDFEKDIQFQFFSRYSRKYLVDFNNNYKVIVLTLNNREYPSGVSLKSELNFNKYVNRNRTTKFITHGWMSGGSKDTCILIKDGFLYKYNANIFIMDWSAISGNPFYPIPMMATPEVGKYYGKYLNYLIEKTGINPKDIHMVGHSLGAHVSGFAGREIKKGKIGRISGLDPALPGFDVGLVSAGTLSKSDADFVDVIHTCAGFLGYKTPLGHADFYPNGGGPPQPGCSILQFLEACSHGRSWKIYASSLVSEKPFIATKCSSLSELDKNDTCHGETSLIGDPTPSNTRGVYYSKILAEDLVLSTFDKNKI